MFVRQQQRLDHRSDFADTRNNPRGPTADSVLELSSLQRHDLHDPMEQMALADAADRTLLRLVVYAAVATLVLALASRLGV